MSLKTIRLELPELAVLRIIAYAEYKKIHDRQQHAYSHGDIGYKDSHFKPLANIIQKLDD